MIVKRVIDWKIYQTFIISQTQNLKKKETGHNMFIIMRSNIIIIIIIFICHQIEFIFADTKKIQSIHISHILKLLNLFLLSLTMCCSITKTSSEQTLNSNLPNYSLHTL